MIILSRKHYSHIGKTVKSIEADGDDLMMTEFVRISFTDGSKIYLGTDWRGNECYISERKEPK